MSGANRTKGVRFELAFPPALWTELERVALEADEPIAELVRVAVRAFVEKRSRRG